MVRWPGLTGAALARRPGTPGGAVAGMDLETLVRAWDAPFQSTVRIYI